MEERTNSYHNIFYYYRGPSNGKNEEKEYRQLENNLTKAFVNVLELSDKEGWLHKLPKYVFGAISDNFIEQHPDFSGLKIEGLESIVLQSGSDESRPDASVILTANNIKTKIAVESKFRMEIDENQLQRHLNDKENDLLLLIAKKRAIEDKGFKLEELYRIAGKRFMWISWESIYNIIENEYNESHGSKFKVTKFLLDQYLRYMRMMGLTDRFIKEHFFGAADYESVKEVTRNFAELLSEKISSSVNKKMAVWKKDKWNGWVGITESNVEDIKNVLHFTIISPEQDGLTILFHTEGRDRPMKIINLLSKEGEFDAFWKECILKLTTDYAKSDSSGDRHIPNYYIIFEHVRKSASKNEHEISSITISLNEFGKLKYPRNTSKDFYEDVRDDRKEAFKKFIKLYNEDSESKYMRFKVGCVIGRDILVERGSLEEQADLAVDKIKPLIDIYKFFDERINGSD